MDGGRNFAGCAGHATVSYKRYLLAAFLHDRQQRRKRVEFRHSVGLRTLKADDYDNVFGHLASFEGGFDGFLVVENTGWRGNDVFVFSDG